MKCELVDTDIAPVVSAAALALMSADGVKEILAGAHADPDAANTFMQMYHLFDATGNSAFALEMQGEALERRRHYRIAGSGSPVVRLLAIMGPGGRMANTPVEFLIHGGDVRLDQIFLLPGEALPDSVPDHDVAIVAYSELERDDGLLDRIDEFVREWPRPVLNPPRHARRCARDRIADLLGAIPGLVVPRTMRLRLDQLCSAQPLAFPFTIRPITSHAGEDLTKIAATEDLAAYLEGRSDAEFFVSEYVDCRGADGYYRKARVALIDGAPFICHLAIADSWIVHYLSARMDAAEWKRKEEADLMLGFESGFGKRHGAALAAVARALELDYVVLDCAELADGRLALFEADIGGWVHAIDPAAIFPYKAPVMQKAFAAFRAMLEARRSA